MDDAGVLEFTCDSASLRGSSHVKNLGLDERFELDVRVTLRPDATGLTADASIAVTVDLPMPFSLLPKPVLNPLSDGVMQTMSSLFLVRIHPCSWLLSRYKAIRNYPGRTKGRFKAGKALMLRVRS